jgi:hypothetical protein
MPLEDEDATALFRYIDHLKDELRRTRSDAAERERADAAIRESRRKQTSLAIADEAVNHQRVIEHAAEFEPIYAQHGRDIPMQQHGEHEDNYRRRLLSGLQRYADGFEDVDLFTLDRPAIRFVAHEIIEAARSKESSKVDIPPGVLREIKRADSNGFVHHEFVSSDGHTFIHEISAQFPRNLVKSIADPSQRQPVVPVHNVHSRY